ncbi:MAG: glycoside hydrolase family 43 protein [Chloroflexota bacterium]|nr:glycoside hydrolase family 43 protein [Chloroflexota bacterium]
MAQPRLRQTIVLMLFVLCLLPLLVACGGENDTSLGARSTPTQGLSPASSLATAAATAAAASTPLPTAAPTEAQPTQAAPTQAATAPVATGTSAVSQEPGEGEFTNPVYESNFPDPHVLEVDGTYYAYATNDDNGNVQTLQSKDLVNWTEGPDAMPELAPWVNPGKTWAPEVLRRKDGKYILYYTADSAADVSQCIGRAVSDSPLGPFVDRSNEPFICQVDEGGSIDASPFVDSDGTQYLLWKNDGNCCSLPTYLYAQQLSPDGLKLVGKSARLAREDAMWEGNLVEAPTMWKEEDSYYLFYSANAFDSELYAMGYATCETPLGPCKDAPENPILTSKNGALGPGHQTIIQDDDGEEWLVYHAWPPDAVGSTYPGRVMWIDRLRWENGKPIVDGPTAAPQPEP